MGSSARMPTAPNDSAHDRSRLPQLDLLAFYRGLRRDFDQHRSGATGAHLPERLGHGPRDLPGTERSLPPLGHGPHHIGLVEDLVNASEIPADLAPGIWPAMTSTGDEQEYAVATPAR